MAQFAHVRTSLAKSNADEVQLAADPEDIEPLPDVPLEIKPHVHIEPKPRHGNASGTSTENGDNDNEAERDV